MKPIQVRLPEEVANQAEQAIQEGLFGNLDDLVRVAILQLLQGERLREIEEAQLADIQTAIRAAS